MIKHSVKTKDSWSRKLVLLPFISSPASHCFYCGEKLTIPAVMWNGRDGRSADDAAEIWLHPKCARLSRDVDEIEIGKLRANEQFLSWKQTHPFR